MSNSRRVVITGFGALTAYGAGWAHLRTGVLSDASGLAPLGEGYPGAEDKWAAVIRDLSGYKAAFPKARPPHPIRSTRLLLTAAHEALHHSGLDLTSAREDVGIAIERQRGPTALTARAMEPVYRRGPRFMSPLLFSQSVWNASAGAVATAFGLMGPYVVSCGSGSVLFALDALQRGEAKAMLVGGHEEIDVHSYLAGERRRSVATGAPEEGRFYPWSGSDAPYVGEGAVCYVLEDAEHAVERGATIFAELLAWEQGIGARSLPGWGEPSGPELAEVARRALRSAEREPDAVGLLISGANGHGLTDQAEAAAQEELKLGERAAHTLKAHLGDTFGMAMPASIAWAADCLARGGAARTTAPRLRQRGATAELEPLVGETALVTNIEYHVQYCAAVLERWRP